MPCFLLISASFPEYLFARSGTIVNLCHVLLELVSVDLVSAKVASKLAHVVVVVGEDPLILLIRLIFCCLSSQVSRWFLSFSALPRSSHLVYIVVFTAMIFMTIKNV